MTLSLQLPQADGTLKEYTPQSASTFELPSAPLQKRIAFAAVHVVCDPLADNNPTQDVDLDWEATLAFRHYLWSLGLAVAEAMDTAQRGMGLDWEATKQLIQRSVAEAKTVNGTIGCGAGTDHLSLNSKLTVADVIAAYEEQCGFIEQQGGQIILMASRALAACATGPDDYHKVYNHILGQVSQPVIIHWLGDMFDPALKGYWGSTDFEPALDACLDVIVNNRDKVDGVKMSLLDDQKEIIMRRRLPEGVRMYTGDDFNYAELIEGDEVGYSDALLGIFDAIAPAASAALHALDAGDLTRYHAIFQPTVPLSRHIFQAPTFYYKTGIVFMAYLNGHQDHFRMVGGQENARSLLHLVKLFELADLAGLWRDPEIAVDRMRRVLAVSGIN